MIPTQLEPAVSVKLPPRVRLVKNKVGRPYLYWQRGRGTSTPGPTVRLPDDPRSQEFWLEYARLEGMTPELPKTNTVSNLIEAWKASPEWRQMSAKNQVEWTRHCKRVEAMWGDLEVKGILPKHCLELRDLWADKPATANNMLRCLSSMMGWSVPRGWRNDNPCREVPKLRGGDGYAPWPQEAIDEAKEVLAPEYWWYVALSLYTGQRKGDVLRLRWDALRNGLISVKQSKTGKLLLIPVHRELAAVLETIQRRAVTILTSPAGTPWDEAKHLRAWRNVEPPMVQKLGLVPHGLRKSAVVTLLEAGCTDAEVASITGQSREMVAHYAKQVNQLKLARAAILRWEQNANRT